MRASLRVLKLFHGYGWLVFWGFVTALAQIGLSVTVPRIVQLIIDRALVGGQHRLLYIYGLVLLGIGIVRFGVAVARRLVTGKVSLGIEYDLRNRLWAHLVKQPFSYYDGWPTGQLMSRAMSDVQNVRMFLGYGLIFFTANLFTMIAVVVLLLMLSPGLALISLAFLPFLVLVTIRFSRRLHPVLRDVQQKIADVTAAAEENVVGSRIVKIFAQEEEELEKFSARSMAVFEASVAAARLRAFYIPMITFLPNAAVAVLLWYGARLVIDGSLTIGALVAFYSYLMMLIFPAQTIGWLTGLAQRAVASAERVYELLDTPVGMTDKPDAVGWACPLMLAQSGQTAATASGAGRQGAPGAGGRGAAGAGTAGAAGARLQPACGQVTFEHVTFAYDQRTVLSDVTLHVPAGQAIALVGHTGCGKTTLANLVPRFYDVSDGRVLVDGLDVRDYTMATLRAGVGVVNQDPFLFSASIAENIRLGNPAASDEQVREAATRAQADTFVSALPEGYETVIGERGLTLSGGQRQRVAIARALVMDPRILILDDAMSSVDVETENRIRAALAEVMRGRTTFIIAHRPSTIALAEEVVVLDHGRIAERGRHAELLAAGGLYARMFGRAEETGSTLDVAENGEAGGAAAAGDAPGEAEAIGDGEKAGGDSRPARQGLDHSGDS
jgi:ABC-type multidrug transport system fused ATPase/permease subunit